MRAVFVVGFSKLASARYSTHRQSAPLARWEKGWGVKAVFVVGFGTLAGACYSTCGEALRVAQGTSPYGARSLFVGEVFVSARSYTDRFFEKLGSSDRT